jgi:hypothetical protein
LETCGNAHHHNGVAVGRRACGLQGPERGRGAGPVDHQHVLPEPLFQTLLQESRGLVDRAAGRIGDDQLNRPVGEFGGFARGRMCRGDRDDTAAEQCGNAARDRECKSGIGSRHGGDAIAATAAAQPAIGHGRHDFLDSNQMC